MWQKNIDQEILEAGEYIAFSASPCTRRRYCAQIRLGGGITWKGVNERFSDCCDEVCIRTKTGAGHGQMVERGGEAHAEAMALINFKIPNVNPGEAKFYLSGVDSATGEALLGKDAYPCHTCALLVKAGGFNTVTIKNEWGEPEEYKIDEIIKYRESEWPQIGG